MITFQNIGLGEDILRALDELGFKEPTPIQAKTIPHLLESDRDLIALAQTGTGKTAAFSLPIIEQIDPTLKSVQAIILCPTRELCMQITRDIESFTKHIKGLSVAAVYGGARIDLQMRALKKGVQIVVGTPGRVVDLISRKSLNINTIDTVVLDEADEMLDMGFKDDLDTILAETPKDKQTLLFSATMKRDVRAIADNYMNKPDEISAGKHNTGADKVDHLYYMVQARDRYQALRRIADVNPDIYGIVFCRTRRECGEVADNLMQDHYNAEAIHGDLSQAQRSLVMQRFRDKKTQLLIATDVAARGIDVNDLTHVINYSLPETVDTYIHRSGRTGRAQKSGTSISIIHSREKGRIRLLEKKVGKEFIHAQVPKGSDICKSQLLSLISKVQTIEIDEEQISPYLPEIYEQLEGLDREELIKKFVSAEFNRFLTAYKNAPNLNVSASDRPVRNRKENITFANVSINLGKKDGFGVKRLFSVINEHRNLKGLEVGSIELLEHESLIEIDADRLTSFLNTFDGTNYRGKPLIVQKSSRAPKKSPARTGGRGGGSRKGGFDGGGNPISKRRGGYRGKPRKRR